jgi:hypothetical protein
LPLLPAYSEFNRLQRFIDRRDIGSATLREIIFTATATAKNG